MAVEYRLIGWATDGPTLRLDYREFTYAGKFVMSDTGKAVGRESVRPDPASPYDRTIRAAASFSPARQSDDRLWIRYIDVARSSRGAGIGSRLCRFVTGRAAERGYDAVWIAVNNPIAYHAAHKAGFGYTGEEAGLAELLCATTAPRTTERYQAGLDVFRERELPGTLASFLAAKVGADPPAIVADPGGSHPSSPMG